MENKRLIVAVASGILCALSVFAFTQSVQASADAQRAEALARFGGEQIEVCVATRDIAAGEIPNASCVTTRMWISDLLPKDPITSLNEVSSQQLTSPVVQGEVLSKGHFGASGTSLEVPEGCCALSVPAEEVKAVGGAVASGMKVDVYLSGSSGITLLAHEVQILATSTGDSESGGGSKISWVTLAVEPKSVHEFISAAEKGNLYFVLPGEKPEGAQSEDASDDSADGSADNASSDASSDAVDATKESTDDATKDSAKDTASNKAKNSTNNATNDKDKAATNDKAKDTTNDKAKAATKSASKGGEEKGAGNE